VEVGADEYLVGGNLEYINSCTGDNNDDIDHDAPGIVKIVEKSNNR
jgi:hypothetical protein